MPEPGYNDGESPPFWVWLVLLLGVVGSLLLIPSC